uniref:Uncharacterized protein n=1 Tax=Lactuca sativa TaxID=4236 RepID=A0A9R1V0K1_LACSA|nr:hypothetical protein LSAT_V11C700377560 [Lactuca sativa]
MSVSWSLSMLCQIMKNINNTCMFDERSHCHQRKSSNKNFEPRSNISVYDNNVGFKSKKTFIEDFEPKPNILIYKKWCKCKIFEGSLSKCQMSCKDNSASLKVETKCYDIPRLSVYGEDEVYKQCSVM